MDATVYQARYSAWVDKIEQRLSDLCDRYLPADAQCTQVWTGPGSGPKPTILPHWQRGAKLVRKRIFFARGPKNC